jgi:O-antigen/teichoic acid export membrane protein
MLVFSYPRLKEIARFGLITFSARAASTLTVDAAPLVGMWTLGPEAVGVYSLALTLVGNGKRLLDQAGIAIFPSVMKAGALRDYEGLANLYLRYTRFALAITSLVFVGMCVYGGDFLRLWVGPGFEAGGAAVLILGVGHILAQAGGTGPATLQSLDQAGVTLKVSLWQAVASIALMVLLTMLPGAGIVGLALGTAIPLAITGAFVYPRLMNGQIGGAFWAAFLGQARVATLVLVAVAVAFTLIWRLIPPAEWETFAAGVVSCVLCYAAIAAFVFKDEVRSLWRLRLARE